MSAEHGSRDGDASASDELVAILVAIRDLDEAGHSVDNAAVARRLGWDPEVVADRLADARARILIWGVRGGGRSSPQFSDIELTVQGQRLLRSVDT
jgi:hypothetical protein